MPEKVASKKDAIEKLMKLVPKSLAERVYKAETQVEALTKELETCKKELDKCRKAANGNAQAYYEKVNQMKYGQERKVTLEIASYDKDCDSCEYWDGECGYSDGNAYYTDSVQCHCIKTNTMMGCTYYELANEEANEYGYRESRWKHLTCIDTDGTEHVYERAVYVRNVDTNIVLLDTGWDGTFDDD